MNKVQLLTGLLIVLLALCLGFDNIDIAVLDAAPKDYAPLGQQDKEQLQQMLAEADLQPQFLNFERDWDLSTYGKSPWHLAALQNPYQGLDQLGQLRTLCAEATGQQGLAELINHFSHIAWNLENAMPLYTTARQQYQQRFESTVKRPKDIFTFYESSMQQIAPLFAETFTLLQDKQIDSLSAFFYGAMLESDDKDKYAEFNKTLPDFSLDNPETITNMLDKLNMRKMQEASLSYLAMCQVLAEGAAKLKFDNNKVLIKKSVYGLMLIGTTASDSYNDKQQKALKKAPLCLLIDPAGNDLYEMRLNTSHKNPYYLLIDYTGNDIYRSTKPAEMFSSLAGLGISMDLAGDDIYQTDDFAFSAFLGTNIHVDSSGNDCYRCGLFSQGAAMQGIALLVDNQGRDSYTATTLGQGLGSLGGVGALLDSAGADLYELGGKYTHAPLMPNDFRSMGQGMGFGLRSDYAGGLGLLYDKSGNDQYLGGVYAQGVGYWYATGMLIDEAGNDVYNAIYYPQGSGIHLAAGYLYDGGGNDAYYSRHGPGQGAGHDWGLGVLIDSSGNDAYSIEGGNGLGLSNSVGIFVDKMGDDRYERNSSQNYGNAAFSRSTGSIGLFLDAGGKDAYPDSTKANDTSWKKGTYGIGRDIELYKPAPETAPEQVGDDPLISVDAPIAEVFAAASEWEVGSAIQRVREARKVLTARKEEGQIYILANKLNSKSGLEYRALEVFLTDNPDFKAKLYDYVTDPDSLKAKMALSLISETGDSLLIVPIRQHLAEHRYITACLSLLGSIKSVESVIILSQYALHSSERYRYIVARSLRQIASPEAYALLNTMRQDNSFLVQALIRNLPEEKP